MFEEYPAPRNVDKMNQAMDQMQNADYMQSITTFIRRWGLDNSVKPKDLYAQIKKHRAGGRYE